MNRKYSIFNAIRFGVLSLTLLIIPFLFEENDFFLQAIMILIGLVFAFLAYKSFRKKNYDGVFDEQHAPAKDATENEKIAFYKRMVYMSLAAFPLLSYFVIDDINSFENASVSYLNLWWPIAFVYNQFGYWAAILFAPILGAIVIISLLVVIRKIKWQHNKNNTSLIKRY